MNHDAMIRAQKNTTSATRRASSAFAELSAATVFARFTAAELLEKFHPELVAAGIGEVILADPEFQRRVRIAAREDPSLSLSGHMIEIAAAMESENEKSPALDRE